MNLTILQKQTLLQIGIARDGAAERFGTEVTGALIAMGLVTRREGKTPLVLTEEGNTVYCQLWQQRMYTEAVLRKWTNLQSLGYIFNNVPKDQIKWRAEHAGKPEVYIVGRNEYFPSEVHAMLMQGSDGYHKNHPLYSESDFHYLLAKGYSLCDIITLWNRDLAQGATGPVIHTPKPDYISQWGKPSKN